MTEIIKTDVVDPSLQLWVNDATTSFKQWGFVLERGWWKNPNTGLYAAVDDPSMGHGRAVGVYAHRVDSAGTDYMQSLVQIPWYGDGADRTLALMLLHQVLDRLVT